MLTPHAALSIIVQSVDVLPPVRMPLLDAIDRVLAEDLRADIPMPPFDNSAMDGYAVRAQDLLRAKPDCPASLIIVGEIAAGSSPSLRLEPGQAIRIMTGAPIPEGADCVVKVEDTEEEDGRVQVSVSVESGRNIRRAGEDVQEGGLVLQKGMTLTPFRVGMAAAVGAARVLVYPRARVAILATGDELVPIDQRPGPGQIRNSNAYALYAQIQASGAEPVMLEVASDSLSSLEERISEGLAWADAIVSSGGVSMGRYDLLPEILTRRGDVRFSSVAQQPGKPLTYALIEGKPFYGLPGNPVSTMVCFEIYVRPALRRMMGYSEILRPLSSAVLATPVRKPAGRTAFYRARLENGAGGLKAELTGPQGSGMIHSMVEATALVIAPAEAQRLDAGEAVDVLLLEQPEVRQWTE